MQIIVRGKNLAVDKPLYDYVVKKVIRVAKYFKNIQEALVELGDLHQKDIAHSQVAHITLWAKGTVLRCGANSGDLYSAIDLVIDKLERQMQKYKEKKIETSHAKRQPKKAFVVAPEQPAQKEGLPQIAEIKRISPKPMTLEEALLEAKVLKVNYFVFRNATTNEFNVLYRLGENRFGLVMPV
jgi:putative sigma-54 modulation protein